MGSVGKEMDGNLNVIRISVVGKSINDDLVTHRILIQSYKGVTKLPPEIALRGKP